MLKTEINIDPLLEVLEGRVEFDFDYPDHGHQRVMIRGQFTREGLRLALKQLDLDYAEYGVAPENIRDGIAGLIQLFILYCLDEILKRKFELEGELYG